VRILIVILVACLLLVAGAWTEYNRFNKTPLALPQDPLILDVPRGTSLRALSEELTHRGILAHPYFFLALAHASGNASRIKAGEYELSGAMTPPQLLALLISGRVVQRAFTLVEGWTFDQLLTAIANDSRLSKGLEQLSGKEVMAALGAPDLHPEGRFFPETYHFTKGATDLDLLRRAFQTMEQVLAEEWEKRSADLALKTPDEALILASIVEKETGLASERPAIAGVFLRRLRMDMKLQTDPTVIYGMGKAFDGDLRRSDLQADTPYNTYVHHGLPPTPIAMPGREAIHAVLHPEDGDSLYFVAKGDGSHEFSATLTEHNQAVRRYQLSGSRPKDRADSLE
jgi:UPF0755 protein